MLDTHTQPLLPVLLFAPSGCAPPFAVPLPCPDTADAFPFPLLFQPPPQYSTPPRPRRRAPRAPMDTPPSSPPPYSLEPPPLPAPLPHISLSSPQLPTQSAPQARRARSSPHLPPFTPSAPGSSTAHLRPRRATASMLAAASSGASSDSDAEDDSEATALYTAPFNLAARLLGGPRTRKLRRRRCRIDAQAGEDTASETVEGEETLDEDTDAMSGQDTPKASSARLGRSDQPQPAHTTHKHKQPHTHRRARRCPGPLASLPALLPASLPLPRLVALSRWLAVLPALAGVLWCAWHLMCLAVCGTRVRAGGARDVCAALGGAGLCAAGGGHGGEGGAVGWAMEWMVAGLWAVLTAHQSLALTTGLLRRWRVYYTPLPTLIRVLALQAICWPATHLTLTLMNAPVRPAACWAVIGSTTCVSRAVQMWVTSNIVVVAPSSASTSATTSPSPTPAASAPAACLSPISPSAPSAPRADCDTPPAQSRTARAAAALLAVLAGPEPDLRMGRRSRRAWDWAAVARECALPAGVLYVLWAWAGAWRREVGC
ncbi:hypothetical protein OBBRIDRAFT_886890 [Obba rivulosa]|uniref:Uncharacterized protein n=1 Tax=Obba rivulosa TaxID=1052685 RepID=A0A8E2B0C2_9APHY|nr:hypothetical protein OBBRIDRAFT_886890 [Obba rivulosa]